MNKVNKTILKRAVQRAFTRSSQEHALFAIIDRVDEHGALPRGSRREIATQLQCSSATISNNKVVIQTVVRAIANGTSELQLAQSAQSGKPEALKAQRLFEAYQQEVAEDGGGQDTESAPRTRDDAIEKREARLTTDELLAQLTERMQELEQDKAELERDTQQLRDQLLHRDRLLSDVRDELAALAEKPATAMIEHLKQVFNLLDVMWPEDQEAKSGAIKRQELIAQYGLPQDAPAWSARVRYTAAFLKDLARFAPAVQTSVVAAVSELATQGRKSTIRSQDHKKYHGRKVRMPEGTRAARVNRDTRYFWRFENGGARELIFERVLTHPEAYEWE